MNVSLTPELEQFVADTVATGRYGSASEVVRSALRILEEEEQWKAYARGRIEKGLADRDAGRIVDGETAMKTLRETIEARSRTRKAS